MTSADPAEVRALLERPFQVVAGKGGVGRTVVATSLALRSARAGRRTLLLDVNGPDTAAGFLGVPPAIDDPHEVHDNLWLCRMTPRGSMREYALMVLKFKALYNLVFENKLVRYFLRSIPSLAEFTMLGKAWFHTQEKRPDGTPKYERIVVDAPATGHAITFLSVARIVAEIAPAGIMKQASEKMAQVIESKTDACLHVVVLPEEMPVNEGLEIVRSARTRLRMAPGLGVVNRMLPPLVAETERSAFQALRGTAASDARLAPYLVAAERRLDREAWQRGYAERFAAEGRLPTVEAPDFGPGLVDLAWIERYMGIFDRAGDVRRTPARSAG